MRIPIHAIEYTTRLVAPILKKEADVVVGSRYVEGAWMDAPRYRRFGLRVINALSAPESKTGGVKDTQSGFRAYSMRALGIVKWCESSGFGIEAEQLAKAAEHQLRIIAVPISVRYTGLAKPSTKDPMSHGAELVGEAVKLVVEKRPLLMLGLPGSLFIVIGMALGFDVLLTFNATRYFSVPLSIGAVFFAFTGMILDMAGLLLYGMSKITRKIERKGYE